MTQASIVNFARNYIWKQHLSVQCLTEKNGLNVKTLKGASVGHMWNVWEKLLRRQGMRWLLMNLNIFVVDAGRKVEGRREKMYIVMNQGRVIQAIPRTSRENVQKTVDMSSLSDQESISLLNDM
jgi:hypothetical protein